MGCCASEVKADPHQPHPTSKSANVSWNTDLFEAKNFVIDGANIKLSAQKRKAHRIVAKQPFPHNGRFELRIRYVSQKVSSYSLGLFHFSDHSQNQHPPKISSKNVVRLYVSESQGEFQSEGQPVLYSRDWGVSQQDTIVMVVDMNSRVIEWRKQSNRDSLLQKIVFPGSFANKVLFLELIMHEPDTQLNIHV